MTHACDSGAAHRGVHRAVLLAVIEEANRRCDGVLPTGVPGVRAVFPDDLTLVGALQLRWHTRLAGSVEQALEADPGDPEQAVVAGWRRTAEALPGVRAVLDARTERPSSSEERAALRTAAAKDRVLLAAMAGLAAPADPRAAAIGRQLELQARGGLHVAA
jgi:hypothetical protein